MTKYNLFQLIWQGYYSDLSYNLFNGNEFMDDLSGWTYDEMSEYFDLLSSGLYRLDHKVDHDGRVYPVLFK